MTKLQEIQEALKGCFKILLRDQSAQQNFNLSTDGFWFSFMALPLVVLLNVIEKSMGFKLAGLSQISTFDIFGFSASVVVSWGVFLIAASILSRFLGFSANFPTFVVVYNWAQFAISLAWTILSILLVGISGGDASSFFGLLVMFFSYVYLFLILKDTLDLDSAVAAGVCFVEFAIAILVNYMAILLFLSDLLPQ
ncbi:MAG: hypothetical protein JJ879_02735 [Sneathiella sp.]|nr:hypothetical protein [Sneathiella sp.]